MSDIKAESPVAISPATIGLQHTIILGVFIVVAAVSHALLNSHSESDPRPLHAGTVVGEILVEEQGGVAHHKCDGCKIECYDTFVIVYVDRTKVPSWTGDYVLTYPWSKIEHLVMTDPNRPS